MSYQTQNSLRKLETYTNVSYLIVSAYVDISHKPSAKDLLSTFHEQIGLHVPYEDIPLLENELMLMDAFLNAFENKHDYKGLALFSGGNKLWEVIETTYTVPNVVSVGHSPYLEPIYQAVEENKRYLIILADRAKAVYLLLHHGFVEDQDILIDESVPQEVKVSEEKYYGRADKISRHIADHMNRHLKEITAHIQQFIGNRYISGILIGGHKQLFKSIHEHLPKNLSEKVVGDFTTELNIPIPKLVEESNKVIAKLHHTPPQRVSFRMPAL